jgi:hypothetical protein
MPQGRSEILTPAQTTAAVFGQLWEALCDILGAPMTATLLRRSTKRAAARHPQLSALQITHQGFDYDYAVPEGWREPGKAGVDALQDLARELRPLLVQLTGEVVVKRLDGIEDLKPSPSEETSS